MPALLQASTRRRRKRRIATPAPERFVPPVPPVPPVPLELRIAYRSSMISTRIARFLAPMWASRYGISVDTWRILAIIARHGPISAKAVAAHASSDAFHVSRAIERLARKRLIRRDIDPDDRRRARLSLSSAGAAAHREGERILARLEAELLAGLSAAHALRLRRTLAAIDEQAIALAASGRTWRDFA